MKNWVLIVVLLVTGNCASAQVFGCTDPMSTNYNPLATHNDGSCQYALASVQALSTVTLPAEVVETSGLIFSNDTLYTHNDNTDFNLYALDSITGAIIKTLPVAGTTNQDWEEIAQDSDNFYIGDFGNNVSGNRQNLEILKVSKTSVMAGNPIIESIKFSYADQTDFSPKNNNSTDFDCEAMVVSQDSIYLFTKQWISKKTSVYALPKTPGTYIAQFKGTLDVKGLITGATFIEDKKLVVLCGYSGIVTPFLYLLYDFKGYDFLSGNKRKVGVTGIGFHQTEGIATQNGRSYFVSNEHLEKQPFVNVVQKLHRFDLSPFLANYLENFELSIPQNEVRNLVRIYPNPTREIVYIDVDNSIKDQAYFFYDSSGKEVLRGTIVSEHNRIDITKLAGGIYSIKLDKYPEYSYRLFKK